MRPQLSEIFPIAGNIFALFVGAFIYQLLACTGTALVLSFCVALLFFLLSQFIDLIYPNVEPETYLALAVIAPLYIVLPIIRGYNSLSGTVLRTPENAVVC